MILYLAQKYGGCEAQSLADAFHYCYQLEAMGFTVYSPIRETAFYDWMRDTETRVSIQHYHTEIFQSSKFEIFLKEIGKVFNIRKDYPPIDYVARDLQLLESWCDSTFKPHRNCSIYEGTNPKICKNPNDTWDLDWCIKNCSLSVKYQPKLVLVFAPSCLHWGEHDQSYAWYQMKDGTDKKIKNEDLPEDIFDSEIADGPFYDRKIIWDSKGAEAEYLFAHKNNVKCVLLTDLLGGKTIEECEGI